YGAAGVVVLLAGWKYLSYAHDRDALAEQIALYADGIKRRDHEMEDRARLQNDLRTFAKSTLGSDEERVTAMLRKSLNEIIAHFGLIEATVTSARGGPVKNPAAEAKVVELAAKRSNANT